MTNKILISLLIAAFLIGTAVEVGAKPTKEKYLIKYKDQKTLDDAVKTQTIRA